MKVWVKFLLGIFLGILAALILPTGNASVYGCITFLTQLFVKFGRYILIPLVFTTAAVSVNKLRSSKLLWRTSKWTFGIIVLSSLMLTILGLISILIVKLPRIPITVDVAAEVPVLDVKGLFLSLFPESGINALTEGSYLLVCLVFAFVVGWESASEETLFKPVYNLLDSFSKLFYNLTGFFTDVLAVCLIAIMCYWFIGFREILAPGIYTPVIIMFTVDFVIVIGLIYPAVLYFLCHDPHPYKVIYASIASILLSFVSGDENLVLPVSFRHARESLGIRRRSRGFTFPLFNVFARGGSAMVACISFIVIWRSYSSLSIPLKDILWIFGVSFGFSFLLGGLPSGSAFVLLTILCQKYAKGFETSFLLLKPAALIMCSFATVIDTATAMVGSYIVSVKTKMIEHHTIQHFI